MIGLLLFLATLAALLVASVSDWRTKEIPDELTVGFFLFVLAVRLFYSLYANNPLFFLVPLGVAALFALFGLLMYYTKQWGGADFILITGIGLALGSLPTDLAKTFNPTLSFYPFWLTLLLNVMLVGAVYGLLFIFYLILTNRRTLAKVGSLARKPVVLATLLLSLLSLVTNFYPLPSALLFLLVLSYYLSKTVEDDLFVRVVPFSKLREEDWLVDDIVVRGRTLISANKPGVTAPDLTKLRGLRGHAKIKDGVPFAPVFPIAVAVSVLYGDLLTFFIF